MKHACGAVCTIYNMSGCVVSDIETCIQHRRECCNLVRKLNLKFTFFSMILYQIYKFLHAHNFFCVFFMKHFDLSCFHTGMFVFICLFVLICCKSNCSEPP